MTKLLNNIKVPKVLYKYRDWSDSYHRELISKQTIYLANPNSFNDPFDCKMPTRWDLLTQADFDRKNKELIDIFARNMNRAQKKSIVERLKQKGVYWSKDNVKVTGKEYFDKVDSISGVISLTSKPDNLLMWSHYSKNHTGFCTGFDTDVILELKDFDFLGKVKYSEEYPLITGNMPVDERFFLEMFSKSFDWKYEDEYRITKRHMDGRIVKLPKVAFKQLIIGCVMKSKEKQQIIEHVRLHLPNCEIYQAEKLEYSFGLQMKRI